MKLSGKLSVDLKEKEATVELTAVFDQTAVGDATLTGTLSGTVDVQVVKATASVELAASEPLTVSTADASTTVALDVTVGVAKAEPTSVDGTATVTWNGTDYSCAITGVKIHASDGAPHAGTLAVTYDPEQGRSLTVEVVFSEATVTDGTVEVKVNGISLGTMTAEDVKALLEAAGAESS